MSPMQQVAGRKEQISSVALCGWIARLYTPEPQEEREKRHRPTTNSIREMGARLMNEKEAQLHRTS
jgi:hypothetical protein